MTQCSHQELVYSELATRSPQIIQFDLSSWKPPNRLIWSAIKLIIKSCGKNKRVRAGSKRPHCSCINTYYRCAARTAVTKHPSQKCTESHNLPPFSYPLCPCREFLISKPHTFSLFWLLEEFLCLPVTILRPLGTAQGQDILWFCGSEDHTGTGQPDPLEGTGSALTSTPLLPIS